MDTIILILIIALFLVIGFTALWMVYMSIKTIVYLIKEDMDAVTIIGFIIIGCINLIVGGGTLYFAYRLVCQI